MFVVLSHHWCKPGQVDLARERMEKSSAALTAEPGFLYRYRMERAAEPTVLTAFTAWADEEDFQRSRKKRFGDNHDLSDTPYERVVAETYQVVGSVKAPAAE